MSPKEKREKNESQRVSWWGILSNFDSRVSLFATLDAKLTRHEESTRRGEEREDTSNGFVHIMPAIRTCTFAHLYLDLAISEGEKKEEHLLLSK